MRLEVWQGDDSLVIELAALEIPSPRRSAPTRWVTFSISKPGVGSQGLQDDPIAEGIVTPHRREFGTLGMYDGDLGLLNMALIRAYAEARKLLED